MATHSSILAWRIPRTEEPGMVHRVADSRTWLKRLSMHARTGKSHLTAEVLYFSKADVHLPLLILTLILPVSLFLPGQFWAAYSLLGLNGPQVGMKAVLVCRQPGAWGVRSRVAWGEALGWRPAGLSSARCQVLRPGPGPGERGGSLLSAWPLHRPWPFSSSGDFWMLRSLLLLWWEKTVSRRRLKA